MDSSSASLSVRRALGITVSATHERSITTATRLNYGILAHIPTQPQQLDEG